MIEIRNLNAGYKKEIIKNINLSLKENNIVAIIGSSGCGKSTFLKSINRLIEEEGGYVRGECLFKDKNLYKLDKSDLRKIVSMVLQNIIVFPGSIENNILDIIKYHNVVAKNGRLEYAKDILKKVNLWEEVKDKLQENAGNLSGGQKQRLAIAKALSTGSKILLLDEPCSALDIKINVEIEKSLLDIKKECSILIVTHSLAQARRIADTIIYMEAGEIVEVAEKNDFFASPMSEGAKEFLKYLD